MILKVKNLHKIYKNGMHALKGIDFEVEKGEFLVIIGLSGSGKSTLLRCINRLIEPTAGTVEFLGNDITHVKGEELRKVEQALEGKVSSDEFGRLVESLKDRVTREEFTALSALVDGRATRDEVESLRSQISVMKNSRGWRTFFIEVREMAAFFPLLHKDYDSLCSSDSMLLLVELCALVFLRHRVLSHKGAVSGRLKMVPPLVKDGAKHWFSLAEILLVFALISKHTPSTNDMVAKAGAYGLKQVPVVGAWFKRFLIVTPTLLHPFLPIEGVPESWHHYIPSWEEWAISLGF